MVYDDFYIVTFSRVHIFKVFLKKDNIDPTMSMLFHSFHFLFVICFSLLTIIDQLDWLNGIRDL